MSRYLFRFLALALLAAACLVVLPPERAVGQSLVYRPPVDAPVIDPFRAPSSQYGPGNRGLEYATVPGTPVRVVAPGRVAFAGSVAGVLWVTVDHPDGLRSSYGHLRSISVDPGDQLVAGAELGRTGGMLHLGVRRGDEYLDPETLFALAPPQVRLIPVSAGPEAVGAAVAVRLARTV